MPRLHRERVRADTMRVARPSSVALFIPQDLDRRESVSPQAACRIQRTQSKATTNYERDPPCDDRAGPFLRVARRARDRQARDVYQVEPDSLPDVLAMEVASERKTAAA